MGTRARARGGGHAGEGMRVRERGPYGGHHRLGLDALGHAAISTRRVGSWGSAAAAAVAPRGAFSEEGLGLQLIASTEGLDVEKAAGRSAAAGLPPGVAARPSRSLRRLLKSWEAGAEAVESGKEAEETGRRARIGRGSVALGSDVLLGCHYHVLPLHRVGALEAAACLINNHSGVLECPCCSRDRSIRAGAVVDEEARDGHAEQRGHLHLLITHVVPQYEGRRLRRCAKVDEGVRAGLAWAADPLLARA